MTKKNYFLFYKLSLFLYSLLIYFSYQSPAHIYNRTTETNNTKQINYDKCFEEGKNNKIPMCKG